MTRTRPLLMILLVAAFIAPAAAEQPTTPEGYRLVRMTIRPAAEPDPALKYRLLPPVLDQTPGNAADLHTELIAELSEELDTDEDQEQFYNQYERLATLPPGQLPLDEVRAFLCKYPMAKLRRATRMEQCDWKHRIREQGFGWRLTHRVPMRALARMVALQSRLHVAEGDFPKAIDTLQTGFAMARHIGEIPTLVAGMLVCAITDLMLEEVITLAQAPAAPNLYWALAKLPRPLIDLNNALEWDGIMVYLELPALRKVLTLVHSSERWTELSSTLASDLASLSGERVPGLIKAAATNAFYLKYVYRAKAYLAASGRDAETVRAMGADQAVLIYLVSDWEHWRDESLKWAALPYWQAHEGLRESNAAFKRHERSVGLITAIMMPAFDRALLFTARTDRTIGALQAIEAIRMHAAKGGSLPESLKAVAVVPIPINPLTGEAFGYEVDAGRATLRASAPADVEARYTTVFEITLVQD